MSPESARTTHTYLRFTFELFVDTQSRHNSQRQLDIMSMSILGGVWDTGTPSAG